MLGSKDKTSLEFRETLFTSSTSLHAPHICLFSLTQDASISSVDSEVDLGELLSGLREGLEEQSMAKVTEVKAMVEQG